MNNQLNIQIENVRNAYKNGNQEQKTLLENLFGKEVFSPKDIKERVKTFEDAVEVLGSDNQTVIDYYAIADATCTEDILAMCKLRVITEALNEEWHPKFDDEEYRYYPWFCLYTEEEYNRLDDDEKERCCRLVGRSNSNAGASGGFVCASADSASSHSNANIGSRLVFKTRELALYAGKQFIDIWCDFVF